jgi:hypothetical protein
MHKLKLQVEDLSIESFVVVNNQMHLRGTVQGAQQTYNTCELSTEVTKAMISCFLPCDGETLGNYTCGVSCVETPTIE